ncbi:F0F1 ATP synthase subunit A [Candidatus Woesebacteria bacterium]|nr:F0F1 ATP synthase subunit A [Candidatus Woesebacteria bacterium]
MASLNISISAEPIAHFLGLTITNSLLTGWIVTALLVAGAILFSRQIKGKGAPGRLQSFIEMLIEALFNMVESIAGSAKAKIFFPMVATLFTFILFSNWSGLLPGVGPIGFQGIHNGHEAFIPFFRAPTSDVNTTLALGLITMIMVQVYGVKYLGLKYFKKFFDFSNPINFFVGLLELISDLSKVISFTFRLFGNIIAGEILLLVMAMLVPVFGPTPFIALEIFVGFVQALVFMMLASVFINMATLGHGDEHNA